MRLVSVTYPLRARFGVELNGQYLQVRVYKFEATGKYIAFALEPGTYPRAAMRATLVEAHDAAFARYQDKGPYRPPNFVIRGKDDTYGRQQAP